MLHNTVIITICEEEFKIPIFFLIMYQYLFLSNTVVLGQKHKSYIQSKTIYHNSPDAINSGNNVQDRREVCAQT